MFVLSSMLKIYHLQSCSSTVITLFSFSCYFSTITVLVFVLLHIRNIHSTLTCTNSPLCCKCYDNNKQVLYECRQSMVQTLEGAAGTVPQKTMQDGFLHAQRCLNVYRRRHKVWDDIRGSCYYRQHFWMGWIEGHRGGGGGFMFMLIRSVVKKRISSKPFSVEESWRRGSTPPHFP